MASSLKFGRAFEWTARAPFALRELAERPAVEGLLKEDESRRYFFRRLLRVSFENTYYNSSGDACPDFEVQPTPATAELMDSLGLVFKDEGFGFSVFFNTKRRKSLEDYLRRQAQRAAWDPLTGSPGSPPGRLEAWTRLSFVLSLKNPYFLNFTDIPSDLSPTAYNFYFTNQQAHREGGREVVLNPGEYVSADGEGGSPSSQASEVLKVVPTQVSVPVGDDVEEILVRTISGRPVICQPRCVPRELAASASDPTAITCLDVEEHGDHGSPPDLVCQEQIFLDFSNLPEDKYVIEEVCEPASSPPRQVPVLYTSSYPAPLCFVDLLLARPRPEEPGIYPVRNLWSEEESPPFGTRIRTVDYRLRFQRRATWWSYFIVPQPQVRTFEELRIEQLGDGPWCRQGQPVEFAGPCRVTLANGQTAYRFVSRDPVPLEEQSTYCFRLWGRYEERSFAKVLVNRLPVAPIEYLLPLRENAACRSFLGSLGGARIAPAGGGSPPADGCQEVFEELCGTTCHGLSAAECRKRLAQCLADRDARGCRDFLRPGRALRNFSDIYVYVRATIHS